MSSKTAGGVLEGASVPARWILSAPGFLFKCAKSLESVELVEGDSLKSGEDDFVAVDAGGRLEVP
jgi:hypothetical protein